MAEEEVVRVRYYQPSKYELISKLLQGVCYSLLPIGIVLSVIYFVVSDSYARNVALIVVGGMIAVLLICFIGSAIKVLCSSTPREQTKYDLLAIINECDGTHQQSICHARNHDIISNHTHPKYKFPFRK